jgi:hypothetical protein
VRFSPQWKEMLICTMDGHEFVLEFTMGISTVYLPPLESWERTAPGWARGQWERVRADLTEWCSKQKIPLVIEPQSSVQFRPS